MNRYNPIEIEPKWQEKWTESGVYRAVDFSDKPKYVVLTEFPYPSGDGLHLGHAREYTLGDVMARHKRMQGYNVLYPMGYDAFGLPTENYAIKNKMRPQDATDQNVGNFQKQFERLGYSIDWARSFRTTDPDYYRWTQWLFLQFYKHGLAYQDDIAINWCPKCKTGLANEEVVNGTHERCGTPVEKKQLRQWMLAITKYADKLIDGLETVDYPSRIADQQVNWIGKSVGAEVAFELAQTESREKSQESRDSLKFTPELTQMILDGVKTSTIRLEPKNVKVGEYIDFLTRDGDIVTPFGEAKITQIRTVPLSDIPNDLKGYEPLKDDAHKLKNYQGYYGDAVTLDTNFTIYDFEFLPKSNIQNLTSNPITVFTTRPDTLYGATFMVLAPEHELVQGITTDEQREAVNAYVQQAQEKSDIERQDTDREKTGVFTGAYALNPLTDEKIPVWIADYVLVGYGTGAIMAVPAHDERDYAFAKKFDLPIKEVIAQEVVVSDEYAPRPGVETITRDVIDAIIINHDGDYLLMDEKGLVHFVGGGIEDGETPESAVMREVAEESGYIDIESIREVSHTIYSKGYRHTKNKNQITTGKFYEVLLGSMEQVKSEVDEGRHEIKWVKKDDVAGLVNWPLHQEGFNQYIEDRGVYSGEGVLVNSGQFSGVNSAEARELIVQHLEREGKAKEKVNYRLRDWIFSRQHYWGEPIPIIHCDKDGAVPVPDDQLPVTLPEVEHYEPTDTGESPLAEITEWVNTTCPTCGGPAKRETDTMPNWAGSSWYYLRYFDAHNDTAFADPEKLKYWGAVDMYLGGMEHTTLHLLYSRFWHQFFYDIKLVPTPEPYAARRGQGIILAEDGRKMSKSLGNVINPIEIVEQGYGADALRLMIAFIAPYDLTTPWNSEGVAGTHRFLNRVWNLVQEYQEGDRQAADAEQSSALLRVTHKTIKKVSQDLGNMGFNTAISAQMEFVNELYKLKTAGMQGETWDFALTTLARLLAPFAPHIAEEIWAQLGQGGSVHVAAWPVHDEALLVEDTLKIVLQVNGKVRATISVAADASEEDVKTAALANERVVEYVGNKKPTRVIYVPGRLVNVVV